MYSSSSKVYLSTVLVRIIETPYKQQQVSRKDRWFLCTVCVSMFTFNVEGEACVLFIIMWHMIVLFLWSGFLSHVWLSGHQFFIIVALFLIRCDVRLSFHRPVDPHRGKGDYSNVALNPIRMIC